MSFLRHWEIYRVNELLPLRERQTARRPRAHPLHEFPVGYSWRVALQQRPLPQLPRIAQKQRVSAKLSFQPGQARDKSVKTSLCFSPRRRSPLAGFEATTYGRF